MRAWRVLVAVAAGLAAMGLTGAPAHAGAATDAEARFVAKINQLRAQKGVPPLVVDAELTGIGRRWAQHMAEAGQISHNPNYASEVHQDWGKLGENVGMGPDVDTLFDAFVRSAGHYRNLVDPDFNRVGVGVAFAPDGTLFTAHQFMMLRASQPAPAPAPQRAAPAPAPTTRPAPAPRPVPPPRPAPPPRHVPVPAPATAPPPPPAPPVPAPAPPPQRLVSMLEVLRALDARAA